MANHRLLPLRILYTINSSPQYILARSLKPVLVSPIQQRPAKVSHYVHTFHDTEIQNPLEELYATASLKTCLDAICRSSPELVQDDSRDFSVYVLDPLESQSTPAPVTIPANSSSIETPSVPPAGQHPRGVAVGFGLMSWALLADDADSVLVTGTLLTGRDGHEALQVIFALRETAPMRKAALSSTVKSWGLPPPPSKRTRVHASKSHHGSKHPSTATASSSSHTIYSKKRADAVPSTSDVLDSHSVYIGPPRRPVGRPDTGRGKAKANKRDLHAESTLLVTTPLLRNDGPTQQPPESTEGKPLMDLLTAISSSGQNAAILSALSAIDSPSTESHMDPPNPALVNALKQLLSMASPGDSSVSPKATSPKGVKTHDDDIVLLDKENVNPTAFRRRAEREDMKGEAPATTTTTAAGPGADRVGLGSKENSSPPSARKRTLSEFMDERESRHRRSGSMSNQRPQTSPVRGMEERPLAALALGSASVRPRKRFVVPEWAKTETATMPRLSKEAEAAAAVAVEGKGKGKKVARTTGRLREMDGKGEESASAQPKDGSCSDESTQAVADKAPDPVVLRSPPRHFPVFASDLSVGSFLPSSPPGLDPPKTPTRKGMSWTRQDNGPSLFTPTPKSGTIPWMRGMLASPLFTPGSGMFGLASPTRGVVGKEKEGSCAGGSTEEEDLDFPPSSLPIASSDGGDVQEETVGREFEQGGAMQHWSGLPPSSPPPPSSPVLFPHDDEKMEDEALPSASGSGSEHSDFDFSKDESDASANGGTVMSFEEFDLLFSDPAPDGSTQSGVADFDFAEFWESVKPLVGDGGIGMQEVGMGEVDHVRLAEEVQALFSGCLM